MALSLNGPIIKSVATLAVTTTTTTNSTAFAIPIADSYTFYLSVTTAQTTCDLVFQSSMDGGTTYINIPWRFAQVTTATGTYALTVKSGQVQGADPVGTAAGGNVDGGNVADTGGVLKISCVVDPNHMKIRSTAVGSSAWTLYCAAWPRGSTVGVD